MAEVDRLAFMGSLPIRVEVGEEGMTCYPRQFSSGSVGYYGNVKMLLHGFRCQVNFCATVVGSKPSPDGELPNEPPPPPAASPGEGEAKPKSPRLRSGPNKGKSRG